MYQVLDESVVEMVKMNYPEETNERLKTALAKFGEDEVEHLVKMLEGFVFSAPEALRDLVSISLPAIIDCVRAVKKSCNGQMFLGVEASGNQLLVEPIDATMFNNVWGQSEKTDFSATLETIGVVDYIGTLNQRETTSEEEGYIILGFLEKSPTPKVNKVALTRDKEPMTYVGLTFDMCGKQQLAALPEPWIVLPEQSFLIQANVFRTGSCNLIPIGYKVMQAKNAIFA